MEEQKRHGRWFAWISSFGGLAAITITTLSWFENMFHLMGATPSAADRQAYSADGQVAWMVFCGSIVLGTIATLLATWSDARTRELVTPTEGFDD